MSKLTHRTILIVVILAIWLITGVYTLAQEPSTTETPDSTTGETTNPETVTEDSTESEASTEEIAPSEAGTEVAPSEAGTEVAPSETGTEAAPSETGTEAAPSEAGTEATPSETGTEAAPSEAGTEAAPSETGTEAAPSDPLSVVEEALVEESVEMMVESADENGAVIMVTDGTTTAPLDALSTESAGEVLTQPVIDPQACPPGQMPVFLGGTCTGGGPVRMTIQAAVDDAANGWTVWVEAGTFIEQVLVDNKQVTIQGQAGTVIQSPASLVTQFTIAPNPSEPIVTARNNAVLNLINVTVNGNGEGNGDYRFMGVAFHNSGGSIQNSTITAIRETPMNGSQHGVGIYVNNEDGTARNINITGNTVTDYQKNGMVVVGNNLTFNISNNTVTGSGPMGVPMAAQNGIQVGLGASGVISGNTVTNNFYTGTSATATGILAFGPTTVTITNNNLGNNGTNAYLSGVTNSSISGNTMNGGDYGIIDDSGGNNTFSNNTITNHSNGANGGIGYYAYNSSGNQLTGNTISGNDYGIYLECDSENTTITGNIISGNDVGVLTTDYSGCAGSFPTGTSLTQNDITGNGTGVQNDAPNPLDAVNAANNFWGSPTGPNAPGNSSGMGNSASNGVIITPFATTTFFPLPVGTSGNPISGGTGGEGVVPPPIANLCTNNPDFAVFVTVERDFDILRIAGNQGFGLGRFLAAMVDSFKVENQTVTPALFKTLTSSDGAESLDILYIGGNLWRFELRRNGTLIRTDVCQR